MALFKSHNGTSRMWNYTSKSAENPAVTVQNQVSWYHLEQKITL